MKFKTAIIISLVTAFAINGLLAQEVRLTASMEKDSILIGDQVELKLKFEGPAKKTLVFWPTIQDTLQAGLEVIGHSSIDTSFIDQQMFLEQSLRLTSFDSGFFYQTRPIQVLYQKYQDTTIFQAHSNALYLDVITISVDTSKKIKPIKGPLPHQLPFRKFYLGHLLAWRC